LPGAKSQEKTKEQLIVFVKDILDWYKLNNVKAVFMACNTSSAVVLDEIEKDYNFPIFGIIKPTAEFICQLEAKIIGIIATSATIKSNAYSREILKIDPSKKVYEIACPGLVEIVESGKFNSSEAFEKVYNYVNPLLEKGVEKIVLGCTHYPYLSDVINKIAQKSDILIDPAEHLIKKAIVQLENNKLLNFGDSGSRKYFVSSNPENFVKVAGSFYQDCTSAFEVKFESIITSKY